MRISLLVTVAEGVPVADCIDVLARVKAHGARWIGASTPGIIPGKLKMGFLPSVSLVPGPLGLMSKSGTLSYDRLPARRARHWHVALGGRWRRHGQVRATQT